MKKRLLSLVMCLVMVFSLLPSFVAPARAVSGDEVAADDTYTATATAYNNGTFTVTFVVSDGKITSLTTANDSYGYSDDRESATSEFLNDVRNTAATYNAVSAIPTKSNSGTGWEYNGIRSAVLNALQNAPAAETLGPGEEWIYTPVTTPAGGWKTDSTYPDEKLYAKVGDEYVPVTLNPDTIYRELDQTSWTAQEANSWVTSHNQNLFYSSDANTFEIVNASKETWYANAGSQINIYDAFGLDGIHLFNFTDCGSQYYVYTNLNNTNEPVWHKVYTYQVGDMGAGGGYWVTIYFYPGEYNRYYPNAASAASRNRKRSLDQWSKSDFILNNNNTRRILENNDEWQAYGWRIPVGGDTTYRSLKAYYTNGDLYTSQGQSTKYNELYTSSTVLAWPKPGSNESMVYEGPLYSSEQGVTKITYGDGTILTQQSNIAGDVLYNGTLYTRSIGVKGDLVGYKHLSDRNADGSYDLMIDSWATGPIQGYTTTEAVPGTQPTTTVTETTVEKKIPLDVVLVIDQSGSMGTKDMGETITGHPPVPHEGDTWTEREINNGTEYYCRIAENDYRRVYTETGNVFTEADSKKGNKMFSFGHDGVSVLVNGSPVHFNVPTNYYVKYNGEMHKLYMITVGKDLEYGLYPYIYTDDNSTYAQKAEWSKGIYWVAVFRPWSAKLLKDDSTWSQAVSGIRWVNSNGETLDPTDSNGDSVKTQYRRIFGIGITDAYYIKNLYTVSNTATTALYYLDDSGNKVYISNTRTMGEDEFTLDKSKCDGNLYTAVSDSTRVQALRKAAETFTEALAQNAKDNNVNHRMAIVGFAGNMFPSYSTGETAVHNTTTTREYTDTGVFLNNGFVNYGTMNASNAYTKVEGVTSTSGLYINKHYYIKDGDNYLPIAYDYSSARWYYTDNGTWLTSRNGSYRCSIACVYCAVSCSCCSCVAACCCSS